jgi:serine/threonine protein kinase
LNWSDKSAVFLARVVTGDGKKDLVAAKIMQSLPDKEKLTNELNILRSLRHEHVAAVLGSFSMPDDNGTRYGLLIFPLAAKDLQESLETISKHSEAHEKANTAWSLHQDAHKLLPYFACLCKTVLFLHERPRPIKHRDIKPANILIDRVNNVVLADFDISRAYDDVKKAITYGSRDGTIMYSSKDVWKPSIQNDPDASKRGLEWDVVSLGFVFLEMATVLFGRTLEEMREPMKRRSDEGVWRVVYSEALAEGQIRRWLDDLGKDPGQFLRLTGVDQGYVRMFLKAIEDMTSAKQHNDESLERAWTTFRRLSNHCRSMFQSK